jgi:hypothetical protein
LLSQWEERQRAYYSDRKNWMNRFRPATENAHYWWYSLFVEIRSGKLEAFSKYTYVNSDTDNNTLNHNVLAVTVDGRTTSVVLAPLPNSGEPLAGDRRNVPFGGTTETGGIQKEEGMIVNEDVLRTIAAARGGSVQIELKGNQFRKFNLNESVQEGIAQTIDLYNAIKVLESAKIEVQKKY